MPKVATLVIVATMTVFFAAFAMGKSTGTQDDPDYTSVVPQSEVSS